APTFELLGGDGLLSGGGLSYFLDFGNIAVDSGELLLEAELGVRNAATGPAADFLSGDFLLPTAGAFALTGFDSFFEVGFGQILSGLGIGLSLDTTGLLPQLLSQSLILDPFSVYPTLTDVRLDR